MKKTVNILIFLYLVFQFKFVLAEEVWLKEDSNSDPVLINQIQVTENGGFLLYFNKNAHSTCTDAGLNALYFFPDQAGVTTEGIKSLLSVAMMAFATNKPVRVLYYNSPSTCWAKQIVIVSSLS